MKILITGVNSGLGKFLHERIPNSFGLDRNNFDSIKDNQYDVIVHCAFNKENDITDYKKYIDDNIFLTQKLKNLKCQKFIYISSVDVYQENHTTYSLFKKLSESMMDKRDLILRCPTLIGPTMKKNHIEKIKNNEIITLSDKSFFHYILMEDMLDFIMNFDIWNLTGNLDFVPNEGVELSKVKKYFKSKSLFGDYTYNSNYDYRRPIYELFNKFKNSSIKNLKRYYE